MSVKPIGRWRKAAFGRQKNRSRDGTVSTPARNNLHRVYSKPVERQLYAVLMPEYTDKASGTEGHGKLFNAEISVIRDSLILSSIMSATKTYHPQRRRRQMSSPNIRLSKRSSLVLRLDRRWKLVNNAGGCFR